MRKFLILLAAILVFTAWGLLGFGTLISVGYGLYAWAIADVAFKVALWTAFITWIKLIGAGIASLIVGSFITLFVA